jgi:tRNA(Arg) A34 adenosine deaminase TadA
MFISGAASGLFSGWSVNADLEDARSVAIDQATVAALQMHAPEMASRYVDDDLPEPFERRLRSRHGCRWTARRSDLYSSISSCSRCIAGEVKVNIGGMAALNVRSSKG